MARRGSRGLEPSRVNDQYGAREARGEIARVERQVLRLEQQISGPLPSADELERYKAIVPDMPERLLANFEKQADHRMALEKHVIFWDVRRANAGLLAAVVFGLVVFLGAIYLIVNGHGSEGVLAIIVEFLVYGGAFLYGSEVRRRERKQKAQR